MELPLISVIIPAYNVERWLRHSVESICNQSYEHIEIIIVNDGSEDETAKVIEQLKREYHNIIAIHQTNMGAAAARMTGIQHASGEWIGFMDADDCASPEMYKRLIDNAYKYQAEISQCGFERVFPNGQVKHYYNTGRVFVYNRMEGLEKLIDGTAFEPSLCNKLYRKELFSRVCCKAGTLTGIEINEDVLMNYYLFSEAKSSVYEDRCLYKYLVRSGSASTGEFSEKRLKDPLKVTQILLKETENERELYDTAICRYSKQLVHYSQIQLNENADIKRHYREKARKELVKYIIPILLSDKSDLRLKAKVLFCGVCPSVYGLLKKVFIAIRGENKKYSMDE